MKRVLANPTQTGRKLKPLSYELEVRRNQSTQCMKGHSSSAGGANGIGVEICHPYVFKTRQGMLFDQTDERP